MTGSREETIRAIGDVADSLDLPAHVLRFWETQFREIEPVKRAGGRRYYRQRDVDLLVAIRHLLYGEGYTIKGVQRILKEQGTRAVIEGVRAAASPQPPTLQPEPHPSPAPPLPALAEQAPAAAAAESKAADTPLQPTLPEIFVDAPTERAHHIRSAPSAPQRRISVEDAEKLRRALAEIAECKRLLQITRR